MQAKEYIDAQRERFIRVSDSIWGFAELALHEDKSAELLAEELEKEGFRVSRGVAGMPTAFVAEWGDGQPVIGFLGEYDALGGISQEARPVRSERASAPAAHACGHNLLGTAAMAAVMGLRQEMIFPGNKGDDQV